MNLPPAEIQPLDHTGRHAQLGAARCRFLDAAIGDEPVFGVVKTGTRVDVGSWLYKRRVTACLLEHDLFLFATGKRPYTQRIPFDELRESQYNHVTGEVMLAPAESPQVKRLTVPPLAGLKILAHINQGDKHDELA
jgi:hypothetical protein